MKGLFFVVGTLLSLPTFAASIASMDYKCEMEGETRTGTVSIDSKHVVGRPSCMYFGKGPTLCLRFERHLRINDIYLSLRTSDHLRSGLDSNFITLGNLPVSEGSTSINKIKMDLLYSSELSCTYTNVNWKR